VVVPVGRLGTFRSNTQLAGGYATELLIMDDLVAQRWQFSGSLLMSNGPVRRIR
jgi:hypothetical protein